MNKEPRETANRPSFQLNRRVALIRILGGWSLLLILPALYAIARYLVPPLKKLSTVANLLVARVGEIPLNSAKIVKMGLKPVIVVRTETDEYRAFSATCTHLGCTVEYRGDRGGYFHCNCHGGEYDLSGKNISGPPPRPLTPYRISIDSGNIIVSSS
jgi:cytochrome b6-f complex iron-sulfur subunit